MLTQVTFPLCPVLLLLSMSVHKTNQKGPIIFLFLQIVLRGACPTLRANACCSEQMTKKKVENVRKEESRVKTDLDWASGNWGLVSSLFLTSCVISLRIRGGNVVKDEKQWL